MVREITNLRAEWMDGYFRPATSDGGGIGGGWVTLMMVCECVCES